MESGYEEMRAAHGAGRVRGRCATGALVLSVAAAVAMLSSACSWVEVDEQAEAVGVVRSVEELGDCKKLGEIGANTMSRVGFIARDETRVAVELERLARNDAAAMGANTLVPLGPVTAEGTRRYAAYRCDGQ